MKSKDLRKKLLETSSGFRKQYLKRNLPLEISHLIAKERIRKGLTQEQLAKLIGTKQSGIARTERGTTYPTIELLERIANKLGIYLSIEFKETETHTKTWDHPNNNSQLIESAYFSINNFSLTQPHQDSKTKN